MNQNTNTDAELLVKLNEAVAVANEAETEVTTAQAELVSHSKAVGLLLLEAKKLHPAVADFKAFLKRVDGLKLSRAYDCMKLAGGRVTEDELKKDARERKQKSRAKKKIPSKPEPLSVTDPHVTESPEADSKAEDAPPSMDAARQSSRCLAEFTVACHQWLPRITVEADRETARQRVAEFLAPKAEAA